MNALAAGPCAKKFFVSMMDDFELEDGGSTLYYNDKEVHKVWLQGVIIQHGGEYAIDDGTGCILLNTQHIETRITDGMYAAVIGVLVFQDHRPTLGVHQLADLSADPNRESLWNVEVVDIANKFYKYVLAFIPSTLFISFHFIVQ